jgi:hypothetical protein
MLAHGFTAAQMVKLVRLGLATATAERVVVSARTVGGAKLRITAKGRQARRSSWSPITPGRSRIIHVFEISEHWLTRSRQSSLLTRASAHGGQHDASSSH